MPKTRTVSVREFRENMTKFLREAQEKNIHFIVMRHAIPIVEVKPVARNTSLEALIADIAQARKDAKRGKVFSAQEVREILGL